MRLVFLNIFLYLPLSSVTYQTHFFSILAQYGSQLNDWYSSTRSVDNVQIHDGELIEASRMQHQGEEFRTASMGRNTVVIQRVCADAAAAAVNPTTIKAVAATAKVSRRDDNARLLAGSMVAWDKSWRTKDASAVVQQRTATTGTTRPPMDPRHRRRSTRSCGFSDAAAARPTWRTSCRSMPCRLLSSCTRREAARPLPRLPVVRARTRLHPTLRKPLTRVCDRTGYTQPDRKQRQQPWCRCSPTCRSQNGPADENSTGNRCSTGPCRRASKRRRSSSASRNSDRDCRPLGCSSTRPAATLKSWLLRR